MKPKYIRFFIFAAIIIILTSILIISIITIADSPTKDFNTESEVDCIDYCNKIQMTYVTYEYPNCLCKQDNGNILSTERRLL